MEGAINRVRVPFERSVINPGRHRKMVCQNVAKGKFTSSLWMVPRTPALPLSWTGQLGTTMWAVSRSRRERQKWLWLWNVIFIQRGQQERRLSLSATAWALALFLGSAGHPSISHRALPHWPFSVKTPIAELPCWPSKESTCQCWGPGLHPWPGKVPHAEEHLRLCAAATWVRLCSTTREATIEKPVHSHEEWPCLPQPEKACIQQQRPSTAIK